LRFCLFRVHEIPRNSVCRDEKVFSIPGWRISFGDQSFIQRGSRLM